MNLNNYTLKAQETIQKAQQLAMEYDNQAIEPGHILAALFMDDDSPVHVLLKKLGMNTKVIEKANNAIIQNYSKSKSSGHLLTYFIKRY